MKIYTLRREQKVPKPVREVFEFFSRPENLAELTPASLSFAIKTPSPILMKKGARIDYTIRLMGLPVSWTTLIESFDAPNSFTDIQEKGPYALWHHTHRFLSVEGGTLVVDEVRYAVGWGFLGRIAHRLYTFGELKRIFDYRAQKIGQIFNT